MWFFYALGSAFTGALVAIFSKLGVSELDATLAATVRSVIMTVVLVAVSLFLIKSNGEFSFAQISVRQWWWITLSALAGACSWILYFFALQQGAVSRVVAVDRLSLVFAVVLAGMLLGESLSVMSIAGVAMMTAGALLLVFG